MKHKNFENKKTFTMSLPDTTMLSPEDCLSFITSIRERKLILELDQFNPCKTNDNIESKHQSFENANNGICRISGEFRDKQNGFELHLNNYIDVSSGKLSIDSLNTIVGERKKQMLSTTENSSEIEAYQYSQTIHNLVEDGLEHVPVSPSFSDLIAINSQYIGPKEILICGDKDEQLVDQTEMPSCETNVTRKIHLLNKVNPFLNTDYESSGENSITRQKTLILNRVESFFHSDNESKNENLQQKEVARLNKVPLLDTDKDLCNTATNVAYLDYSKECIATDKTKRYSKQSTKYENTTMQYSLQMEQSQGEPCDEMLSSKNGLKRYHGDVHDKTCHKQNKSFDQFKSHEKTCEDNIFRHEQDQVESTVTTLKRSSRYKHLKNLRKQDARDLDLDEKTQTCLLCNLRFRHLFTLRRHMKVCRIKHLHTNKSALDNDFDNKTNSHFSLSNNENSIKESNYTCETCEANFSRLDALYQHIKKRHKNIWKQLNCKFCNKAYSKLSDMKKHSSIHIPDPDNKGKSLYKCESCERTFTKQYSWRKHTVRVHSGSYFHVCEICNLSLKSDNLKRHMLIHTRKLPCNLCQMTFKTSFSLEKHKRVEHSIGHKYECSFCDQKFIERSDFKLHSLIHIHQEVNIPYKCKTRRCNKQFEDQDSLNKHMNIHVQKKSLACSHCSKQFSSKTELHNHIQYHLGVKPFVCQICNKGFVDKVLLKRHSIVHTGARQFKCPICYKGFSQECSVKRHMVIHTGDKPYTCSFCDKCYSQSTYLHEHVRKHHPEDK